MISTTVMVLGLVLGATGERLCPECEKITYAAARKAADKTGRPLLALVGAPWCAFCEKVHAQLGWRLKSLGEYGYINVDREGTFAETIAGSGPIPRLAVFRRVKNGWVKTVYVDADHIEQFVKEEEMKPHVAPSDTKMQVPTLAPKRAKVEPAPLPPKIKKN